MTVFTLFCIFPLVLVLLSILAVKYYNYRKFTNLLTGLPTFIKPYPILGHLPYKRRAKDEADYLASVNDCLLGLAALNANEGISLNWLSYLPIISLHSPESVGALLSSQTNITKGPQYNILWAWLKQGLLTSSGSKWKSRRRLLTPTFHYKILDEFQTVIDRGSGLLVQKLQDFTDKDFVDIVPLITRCTLTIICETAMGIKLDSSDKESKQYEDAVHQFSTFFVKRNVNPLLFNDTLFLLSGHYSLWEKTLSTLHKFTRKILNDRKQEMTENLEERRILGNSSSEGGETKKRQAFLDLLLQEQFTNNSLTDDDICEEVDTFTFEGHDTTAMGISWTLYHLGRYPHIQQKVYQELQDVLGDGKKSITPEDLKKMTYLECVVKESQRLSPSVPAITRTLTEDLNISKYRIPKGINVLIHTYSLHRNPKVFPNPEIFDPSRFLPEATAGRSPFAYIPFSAGPRNCIGQRFAMMELKTAVAHVIKNYIVESIDPPDKVRTAIALVLRPIDGLKLRIRNRI